MIIAVDTGGTKTLVATFDDDGVLTEQIRFPTPLDYSSYLEQVTHTIATITRESIAAIAVAMPGIVRNGVAINCPNLRWENISIVDDLKQSFPDTVILLENDANLGGLGEVRLLEQSTRSSLYVTVSTGIGTGVIEFGKIDESMSGSEAGHMLLEYDGKLQPWEEFSSGRAIFNTYQMMARDITDPTVWRDIADRLARGFLVLIPVIQPDTVIIGGSMGTHFAKYQNQLEAMINDQLPSYLERPQFIAAQHPEEAVAYGGYFYAIDHLATN